MTFDPAWDAAHTRRRWGRVPCVHMVRFLAREFSKPGEYRFLDIGAGSGAQTAWLAELGKVTALEGSQAALDRIADLVMPGKFGNNITTMKADIGTANFPDHTFDCIVDVASLQHLPHDDAKHVIQRARRWLKPGGWFFQVTDGGSDTRVYTVGTVYDRTIAQVVHMFGGYAFRHGYEDVQRPDGVSTRHWIVEAKVQPVAG